MRYGMAVLFLLALCANSGPFGARSAQAQVVAESKVCGGAGSATVGALFSAAAPEDLRTVARIHGRLSGAFLPSGQSAEVVVPTAALPAGTGVRFDGYVSNGEAGPAGALPRIEPVSIEYVGAGEPARVLPHETRLAVRNLPSGGQLGLTWLPWLDGNVTLAIAACAGDGKPQSIILAQAPFSARWPSIIAAIMATMLAWFVGGRLARRDKASFPNYLDPAEISRDFRGHASLSRFQIFVFTLTVALVLTHIFARTGALTDLSESILWLMGIAGIGTVAARFVGQQGTRARGPGELSAEDEALAYRLIPADKLKNDNAVPRWSQLVMTDGELDVFKYQNLIFIGLVAGALLNAGLNELATFTIPTTMLALLGLGQAVYVAGKLVPPPTTAQAAQALQDAKDKLKGVAVPRDYAALNGDQQKIVDNLAIALRPALGIPHQLSGSDLRLDALPQ